uniref:Lipocalin/cytosolic fatty-acid binding domain-containing protein n=1 Tax=Oryzias latipes TaxID=8090 RepID=A0A3P9LMT1_ORYLA
SFGPIIKTWLISKQSFRTVRATNCLFVGHQTLVCFYTKFAIYILAMKAESTFKTTEIKFKLDEEFNETTVHGRNVKSTFTLENGKFVQKQNSDGKTSTLYIGIIHSACKIIFSFSHFTSYFKMKEGDQSRCLCIFTIA